MGAGRSRLPFIGALSNILFARSNKLGRRGQAAKTNEEISRSSRSLYLLPVLIFLSVLPEPAVAQDIPDALFSDDGLSARALQLFLLLSVLSIAPGIVIMITCFPFIVTVLAILRQAIGLQQSPPNMLLISLALFLTWYVMDPVISASWQSGVQPYLSGTLDIGEAFQKSMDPFRIFMGARIDLTTLAHMAELRGMSPDDVLVASEVDLSILVPSFLLSEIEKAFQVGFLIFLPFLIIDLVVAAILMSMGMMMVPPAIVSLPFKLAFFVVADGWSLIAASLVRGYL